MKSLTFLFMYFMLLQIYNDDYGSDGTLHYTIIGQYKFGTKINLDGYGTVVVQDRTAQWVVDKYGENIIDIYFDDHQVAEAFECHYMKGVVI